MKALACFGAGVLVVAIAIVGAVVNGLVLSLTWGWFIVSLFDAKALSIPEAIGIALVAGLLTHQQQPKSDKEQTSGELAIALLADALINPLLILAVGYIVHLFI
jgi:hypothetical protein